MKIFFLGTTMLFTLRALAQDSATNRSVTNNPLTWSGYVEPYYCYDFDKPADNNRPAFLYSFNRHNEFNINLAYLKGSYNAARIRASFSVAAGTYMNANYTTVRGGIKNIFEANAGVRLVKKKNLWVDMGIFPSHIGYESAISATSPVLTRSIIAENSPYYESGAKISYTTKNAKWMVSILALNGWQRIERLNGNSLISWGTQATFTPSEKTSINYSTFLGTDAPDSIRRWRYFHDFYAVLHLTNALLFVPCFDIGQEQKEKGSSDYKTWYGTSVMFQYVFAKTWTAAARAEYYHDVHGVIIITGTPDGFQTSGFSVNFDKSITTNFLWRTEFRWLHCKDAIFVKDGNLEKNNSAITTSFALTF